MTIPVKFGQNPVSSFRKQDVYVENPKLVLPKRKYMWRGAISKILSFIEHAAV